MADFKSSDIEIEEPQQPFTHLDQNAISKIVEDASEARLRLKKTVKTFQVMTSPGVDYARADWLAGRRT